MYETITIDENLTLLRLWTRASRQVGFSTYVAWLDGALIDSGFARARGSLLRALSDESWSGGRAVEAVLNTHCHEDHCGNDAALRERFGAEIRVPVGELPVLRTPGIEPRGFYRHLIWGIPEPCDGRALAPVELAGRVRLEVLPAPGHCPNHVVFFDPERRRVFMGDTYLGVRQRGARPDENWSDLIETLERVLALRPAQMVCYHSGMVADPLPRLEAKLEYLLSLRSDALRLRDRGASLDEIARRLIVPRPRLLEAFTFGDFSARNAARALLKEPGSQEAGGFGTGVDEQLERNSAG